MYGRLDRNIHVEWPGTEWSTLSPVEAIKRLYESGRCVNVEGTESECFSSNCWI